MMTDSLENSRYPEGRASESAPGLKEKAELEAIVRWAADHRPQSCEIGRRAAEYIRATHAVSKVADKLIECVGLVCSVAIAGGLPGAAAKVVVRVPMRDNVRLSHQCLSARRWRGRFPALLVRTPYGKGTDLIPGYRVFLDRKFALVVQDVRGRYASEGFFQPPIQEDQDGYDTIDWIARQSWSDGNGGHVGRIVSRHRAVARGVDGKPASAGDLSGRFRIG